MAEPSTGRAIVWAAGALAAAIVIFGLTVALSDWRDRQQTRERDAKARQREAIAKAEVEVAERKAEAKRVLAAEEEKVDAEIAQWLQEREEEAERKREDWRDLERRLLEHSRAKGELMKDLVDDMTGTPRITIRLKDERSAPARTPANR